MTRAAEAAAIQRQALGPDVSVWVSASAGTGKTKVLTDRLLALMLDGTDPARILCLTFTRAAAAEMANRVNDRLAAWATLPPGALAEQLVELTGHFPQEHETARARQLFARVLDIPGGAKIATIHAFCQSLLRRFPLEAGVPPEFAVIEERSAAETLTEAAETLGAGWPRILFTVILPNVRMAVLSGAFLTFAIVIGEFTMASLLSRPAFGPYLQLMGANRAYEPSALAIIAFVVTWACMGLIQIFGRDRRATMAGR